ncbi:MAG TPA: ATP-binding protein [Dehalococcoidia bacterium]|nr:ATP-binding protein [Dehalococcoidia bacterium]
MARCGTIKHVIAALRRPLDSERRASLAILVTARWFLLLAALVAQDYHPGSGPIAQTGINLLIAGSIALNAWLHLALKRGRPVGLGLAVLVSVYDAAAITAAIVLADGFTSSAYILYYPALLAFALVFPGRWGVLYGATTAAAYFVVSCLARGTFHPGSVTDQKTMELRLATMAASVLIANLIVRLERERRERAVAAETERREQVLALEKRALELERVAQEERARLSREVHDGISQNVYMLSLGLETAALIERETHDAALAERLEALVRLAKGTLLETRNLLFDLAGVMAGEQSLTALVQNQAREFTAITGIPAQVTVEGEERTLPPATVGEVYRVLQEGLANVFKHARAGAVTLRLRYGARALDLQIADSGAGFDAGEPAARGYGLKNMQARAARVGGGILLASRPGAGTTLTVTVPYGSNIPPIPQERSDAADPRAAG